MFCKKSGLLLLLMVVCNVLIGNPIRLDEKIRGNTPSTQLNVTGLVTVDGIPASSEIQINSLHKNDKSFLKVEASKVNGVFTLNLPLGDVYEIVIEVAHFPPQVIELSTMNIDTALSLNAYADFTSPAYDKKLEELTRSNSTRVMTDKMFNKTLFEQSYGQSTKADLKYKVQIGAFKFFENFNYNSVIGMPKIIRQTDNDLITRFTMGNFETYNQAKELLERLQKTDAKDAFIIAVYKGEKKFLNQLMEEKILD